MTRRALFTALVLGVAATGCDPEVLDARPQWLVSIGTDAPVPQLGDRVLVEILRDDGAVACAGCRRQIGLELEEPGAGLPLSFGIVAEDAAVAARLRVRLYRSGSSGADGLPPQRLVIDATGRLPPATGITEVAMPLFTACFDVAADVAGQATCDPATGALAPEPVLGAGAVPATGSWPEAAPAPCPSAPPEGMACVEGGVFLLGGAGFEDGALTTPERLARISPFALDVFEVTVDDVKALVDALPRTPLPATGEGTAHESCTWPDGGAMPVNCIDQELAMQICAARGLRLPTEAEWELAAGQGPAETPFPWGHDDQDLCARAVLGRGHSLGNSTGEDSSCRTGGEPVGPVAGGSPEDVGAIGVRNLGGNVAEWVDGVLAPYDDPCWGEGVRLVDPVCRDAAELPAVRGGSWLDSPFTARVVTRRAWTSIDTEGKEDIAAGVRCAKSF